MTIDEKQKTDRHSEILTCEEIYCIIQALKARQEFLEAEGFSPDEEPHISSALRKLKSLKFGVEKEESE